MNSKNRPTINYVILLHGLAKTKFSMVPISINLKKNGFIPVNIGYPSRKSSIEQLACYCHQEIAKKIDISNTPLNFITHSMGGIILRTMKLQFPNLIIDKVVMIAPPNQGSHIATFFSKIKFANKIIGLALKQLSDADDSFVNQLPLPNFVYGIIAGKSWLGFNSSDGKIKIPNTKLANMHDFFLTASNHSLIVYDKKTINKAMHFLKYGRFD